MRNSTRRSAFDSVRNVFGRLKDQFESKSRKGLKDSQLKTRLAREVATELISPLESRTMLTSLPNLVLTPNQSVGGTLQGTYAVVDISALTSGDLYFNDETASMGRLFKVVRDANGQVTGVTPIGQIAQVNGSAVIQLSSLTTGPNGNFYTAGVDGSSFLPVDNVGKDLQTAKLSVQALAISSENDPASGLQRIFIIDSNGSTLDLYELHRSTDGSADKLTSVGINGGAIYTNVLDDDGNVVTKLPVLGLQSAAIAPTGNSDVVSIGYRADEVAPQNATGYVADSFDIRGVTVRPQDLTTNDQTYLLNRRDPFRTKYSLPEFEIWQVTRDPLTQAILNNEFVGTLLDGSANVIRTDAIESDPETGSMTTLGLTYKFDPVPTIGVQGNLGDSYPISDIAVTRLTQATGTKGSIDSVYAVVGDNAFADLYRIRQGTAATPDPTSGIVSTDSLVDPNDPNASPMQRLGRLVDTKNQPLYFVQALASDWSTAMSPTATTKNYVWAVGSSSPSANASMSLYRFDLNGTTAGTGKEAYQAVEEFPLNDGIGSLNYVVKGLAYKPWTQDMDLDAVPDQGELYAVVAYPDGDHIIRISIPSPGFDALNQATPIYVPTDNFGQQLIGRVTDDGKLSATVSSIDFQMDPYSANPIWKLYGLSGKVGDANRSLVAISGTVVSVVKAVDPYMRGLSFGTMQTPLGDAVRTQPYSIKGSLQINSRDQLLTSQWTSAYYGVSETSGSASLKYKLLFNSSDPTAPAQLKINALTESQVRDWEIRPGRSDGEFKALATDPTTGVIYGVLEVVDNAKLGAGVKQLLVKIDPNLKQSTQWGDFVQVDPVVTYEDTNNDGVLDRVGGVIAINGVDTQILEMDFTRTGELIGLQRLPNDPLYNTTATNSLLAINRINPTKSTKLVDDSIQYTGMRALYNQFPVGLGSSPLGRYLSVVPDPKPVDNNGLKQHTIIPNKYNQVSGSLYTGPAIIDLDTSTVVDFNTGLKFTYAFTGTEGTEQLVRLNQTVGSDGKPVIDGYTIVDNRIEVDMLDLRPAEDYWVPSQYQIDDIRAMSVGADGSIYFAGQHTGSPRPVGTIEFDEDPLMGGYGKGIAGLQLGGSIAVSPDGLTAWVMEGHDDDARKGIWLGRLERNKTIDPITGKPIGTWVKTAEVQVSNIGYSFNDGLEYDPVTDMLYANCWVAAGSDGDQFNSLVTIDPLTLSVVGTTDIFDSSKKGTLSPEYLLKYINGTSGYTSGTLTIQRRDGQTFSMSTANLETIGDLQAAILAKFGDKVQLVINGKTSQLQIVDTTPGDTSIKLTNETWQLNNGSGISVNSGAGVPDMVFTFNAGGSDLLTTTSQLKYLNNGAGVALDSDPSTPDIQVDFYTADGNFTSSFVKINDRNGDGKITISDVTTALVNDTSKKISVATINTDSTGLNLTFNGVTYSGVVFSNVDPNFLTAEGLGIAGATNGANQFFANIKGGKITPVTDPAITTVVKQVDVRDFNNDGTFTVQDVLDSILADTGGLITSATLSTETTTDGDGKTTTFHKGLSLVFQGNNYSSVVVADVTGGTGKTASDLHLAGTYTNAGGNNLITGSPLTPTVYTTIVSGTAADTLQIAGQSDLGIVTGTALNPVKVYMRYQTNDAGTVVLGVSVGQIVRNPFDNSMYVVTHGLLSTDGVNYAGDVLLKLSLDGSSSVVGTLTNTVGYRNGGMYFNQYNQLVVFENRAMGLGGVATDGKIWAYQLTDNGDGTQSLSPAEHIDGGEATRKIKAPTYDLAMDAQWRSYSNVGFADGSVDVWASGEELYQIQLYQVGVNGFQPGDSGTVIYKGDLVSTSNHVIDDVNGIAFNVPGGAYILSDQYSTPQVFQIRTDAFSDFYTSAAKPLSTGPYESYEGEIIVNPRNSAYGFDISDVYAFDIEFTRTDKLTVVMALKDTVSFPWKGNTVILPTVGLDADGLVTGKILGEVNLASGSDQSFVRARTGDDSQDQYLINPFDKYLRGFSTDVSGVFSSIYSNPDNAGGDRMWLGLPDEVYISPSNQTIYRIDASTAEAKPIAELKDTSLQLQKPVSSVFQALSFNPLDGRLYAVMRDVANNDVNRLVSLATSNPADPYSLTGEFFREGISNGRIQLDDGKGNRSEVNLSGLVFVKVGNEYRMVAEDQINQRLITIDPVVTDQSAGLTAFKSTKDLTGLMVDNQNVMFSIFDTPGGFDQLWKSVKSEERTLSLYEVSPTSAIATRKDFVLDPQGSKVARADLPTMAFDHATNRLFGVLHTAAGDQLVNVNVNDGKMTVVNLADSIIKIDGATSHINTLEFRDGVLYAYDDPAPGQRNLVIIDTLNPANSKKADTSRDLGGLPLSPDPRLVGLAVEPIDTVNKALAGRFFSIMPTDISDPNAPIPFDELWISDRMFAYNQEFVLPEVQVLPDEYIKLAPYLLTQVYGPQPNIGGTVQSPDAVQILVNPNPTIITTKAGGTLTLYNNGYLSYQAAKYYNGVDSFDMAGLPLQFQAQSGDGTLISKYATMTFTVTEINDAPLAPSTQIRFNADIQDPITTTAELLLTRAKNNGAKAGPDDPAMTVIREADQTLKVSIPLDPGQTKQTVYSASDPTVEAGYITVVLNLDGTLASYTFTPAAGFTGQAAFKYSLDDGGVAASTNGVFDPKSTLAVGIIDVQDRPRVLNFVPVMPNPRNTSVSSIQVVFSRAINPATFTTADIVLYQIDAAGKQTPVDISGATVVTTGDPATFQVQNLSTYTQGADGQVFTYRLDVNAETVQDTAGVDGAGLLSTNWVNDREIPQVISFGPVTPSLINTPTPFVDVKFSEAIDPATFTIGSLTLTRTYDNNVTVISLLPATIALVADTDPLTYRISGLTGLTSQEGEYSFTLDSSKIADPAGNFGNQTLNTKWTVDTTPPQVTSVTIEGNTPRNTPMSNVWVVFSEAIDPTTFTAKDDLSLILVVDDIGKTIDISNAGITADATDPTKFLISGLTSFTTAEGIYTLTVSASGVLDLAGNKGVDSMNAIWDMDLTAPQIKAIGPVASPVNHSIGSIEIYFDEGINAATFTLADLKLTYQNKTSGVPVDISLTKGGAVIIADSQDPAHYTLSNLDAMTMGFASEDTTYSLTLDASGVDDIAGNAGKGTLTHSWINDRTEPTVTTIGPVTPNPRNLVVSFVRVKFSEAIDPATFTLADLTLSLKTALGVVTPISLTDATITADLTDPTLFIVGNLNAITLGEGTYTLTVDPEGVTDLSGNKGLPVSPLPSTNWVMDVTRPQITKILPVLPTAVNQPVNAFDVYFNEVIQNGTFATDALSLTRTTTGLPVNLDVTGLTITQDKADPTLFHVTGLDSLTNVEGTYVFTVRADFVVDLAGNVGIGAPSQTWIMDTTALTMKSLGANVTTPRNTQVGSIDVVFGEQINTSTFTIADLRLTRNGTPVSLAGVTIVQPDASDASKFQVIGLGGDRTAAEGVYEFTVDLTTIQDRAGNSGAASSKVSWLTDTSAPTAKLTVTSITQRTSAPKQMTVVFSDVAGVDVSTIQTGNITIFGPGGLSVQASLVSVNPSVNGSPITAVYSMAAPGGEWNALDNGSYTVVVNSNTVGDILGQKMAQSVLGAFEVSILGAPAIEVTVGGAVVTSPYSANFGLHSVGETSNIDFVFKDVGDGVLVITGVTVPAGYKILDGLGSSINPNSTDTLRIGLDTSVPRKTTDAQIRVTTNAGNFVINASGEVFSGIALVSGKAVTYTDATGDKVSVMLRGPGSGVLYFNASGNADAARVELQDTTGNSSLTFTLASGKTTTIQSIAVGKADIGSDQTSIGSIAAGSVDVRSFVRIAGSARTITLGNVTNSLIEVGQSDAYSGQVSISAKHVADTKVHSDIGVSSFTAWDWLDTAASYNSILEAPVVGSMSFLGYAASKVVGNFQADVQIAGPVSGLGLNQFRASGLVSSSVWNVGGTGINSFNAGSFTGVDIDTTGRIGSVTTTANTTVSGMIHAMSIGTMNLRGAVNGLDVDLGSSASPNQLDLQNFTAHSSVKNFNLSTHGKAGTINIIGTLGDGLTSSKITIGSTLTSFSAYSAVGTAIDVAGNVSSIRFTKALPTGEGILDSQINAFAISTFSVTGNVVDSVINLGDQTLFGAKDHVPSVGVAVPSTLPASTNFTITGAMQDSAVQIGGNARTISINKGMTESDLQVIGNIVTLNVGAISNTVTGKVTDHLIKADQIGTFSARGGISKGTVNAVVINNFNVTGSMTNAVLTLSLAPSTLKALGAFTVSGNVTGTTVTSAGNVGNVTINGTAGITSSQLRAFGNIGQVSVSKMIDTVLFAGVSSLVTGLPSATGDFTNTAATIAGVTVRTAGVSFIRSYIAAGGTLTRVALKGVDPVNPAGIFGVAAGTKIGSYSATGQTTRTNLTAIGDYNAIGNFRLRIV